MLSREICEACWRLARQDWYCGVLANTGQALCQEAQERLEEEAKGPQHADQHEDPEEDAVDDHGHVLPVVLHLRGKRRGTVTEGAKNPAGDEEWITAICLQTVWPGKGGLEVQLIFD